MTTMSKLEKHSKEQESAEHGPDPMEPPGFKNRKDPNDIYHNETKYFKTLFGDETMYEDEEDIEEIFVVSRLLELTKMTVKDQTVTEDLLDVLLSVNDIIEEVIKKESNISGFRRTPVEDPEEIIVKNTTDDFVKSDQDPQLIHHSDDDDNKMPVQYGPGRKTRAPGDRWDFKGHDICRKMHKSKLPPLPTTFPEPPFTKEEMDIARKYGHHELVGIIIHVVRRWKTVEMYSKNRCEVCRSWIGRSQIYHHHAKDCFVPKRLRPIFMTAKKGKDICLRCFGNTRSTVHRIYGCKASDTVCHHCIRQGFQDVRHHEQSGWCQVLKEEKTFKEPSRLSATDEERQQLVSELHFLNEEYEEKTKDLLNSSMTTNYDEDGVFLFLEEEEYLLTKDLQPKSDQRPPMKEEKAERQKTVLPPSCKPIFSKKSPEKSNPGTMNNTSGPRKMKTVLPPQTKTASQARMLKANDNVVSPRGMPSCAATPEELPKSRKGQ